MVALIYRVTDIEVQFTASDGQHPPALVITAKGSVNTGGWSAPQLGVWTYVVEPADGVVDFNFLAEPPPSDVIVTMGFRDITAHLAIEVPSWVQGVRVHSATNQEVFSLSGSSIPFSPKIVGDGMPLPWPFPWFTPQNHVEQKRQIDTSQLANLRA